MTKYLYEITKICKEALLAQFCIYTSFLSAFYWAFCCKTESMLNHLQTCYTRQTKSLSSALRHPVLLVLQTHLYTYISIFSAFKVIPFQCMFQGLKSCCRIVNKKVTAFGITCSFCLLSKYLVVSHILEHFLHAWIFLLLTVLWTFLEYASCVSLQSCLIPSTTAGSIFKVWHTVK